MKRPLLAHIAAVAIVAGVATGPAVAGPVEDGVKAYSHAEYANAVKLLTPPAEAGDSDAQYTLSLMCLRGQGVPEDHVRAYMWMALSARAGDPDSTAERNRQEQDLTPDQLAQAKQLVADWKPNK